jgi:hypothetical protein
MRFASTTFVDDRDMASTIEYVTRYFIEQILIDSHGDTGVRKGFGSEGNSTWLALLKSYSPDKFSPETAGR